MGKVIVFTKMKGGSKMAGYSIRQIEDKAAEVLKQCSMNNEIPVDPVLIANELGIRVYAGNFIDQNMSGVIRKDGSNIEILVCEDHHVNRQRFTIAHEIGHYKLHIDDQLLNKKDHVEYERNNTYNAEEAEANSFAAALLMPREALLDEYNKCKPLLEYTDILVNFLAVRFKVSEQAMQRRLSDLGLISLGW